MTMPAFSAKFDIDPFRKYCLLNGLDDIGLTLRHETALDNYEARNMMTEFWSSAARITSAYNLLAEFEDAMLHRRSIRRRYSIPL